MILEYILNKEDLDKETEQVLNTARKGFQRLLVTTAKIMKANKLSIFIIWIASKFVKKTIRWENKQLKVKFDFYAINNNQVLDTLNQLKK